MTEIIKIDSRIVKALVAVILTAGVLIVVIYVSKIEATVTQGNTFCVSQDRYLGRGTTMKFEI
jgi:hypothetical protein